MDIQWILQVFLRKDHTAFIPAVNKAEVLPLTALLKKPTQNGDVHSWDTTTSATVRKVELLLLQPSL